MKLSPYLRERFLRFIRCEQGSVAILTGLITSLVLMAVAGFALDIMRGEILQESMTSALDASALAVAKQVQTVPPNEQQAWANAQMARYFNANFQTGLGAMNQVMLTITPDDPNWDTMILKANSSLSTLIMKDTGIKSINVNATTQVTTGN